MLRLLMNEFEETMAEKLPYKGGMRTVSLVTGRLAYRFIKEMADRMMEAYPELTIQVFAIRNDFFGELITVSGLLTGQDILAQLKDKKLGDKVLLPQNVLRSGETVFLDDMTVAQLEKTLQVPIDIVKSSGRDFVEAILNN